MRFINTHKKAIVAATLAGAVTLGGGIAAFAFFSTTGTGTGSGSVGNSTALVLHEDVVLYSNKTVNALLPGTSRTATFKVDNPSSGFQRLGTITVSSITTDTAHAGCDTATNPGWFSITPEVVNADFAPGNGQRVTGSDPNVDGVVVAFVNDPANPQDVCKGAPLTFNYSSN
jgi:hypothetical protein